MRISNNYEKNLKTRLAEKEMLDIEVLDQELDEGRLVIIGNYKNRLVSDFMPVLVGNKSRKKVCVAIGMDSNSTDHFDEKELEIILNANPDVICDVSIGNKIPEAIRKIRKTINVPLGSCPTYDIFSPTLKEELNEKEILRRIEEHLKAGVDFILLHFGINREILSCIDKNDRIMPITSRGGGDIIRYMKKFDCENPLVLYAESIGELCKKYGVVLDLGDVFRPGCLEDGSRILDDDSLKIKEIVFLAELRKKFINQGVAIVCEAGGHIPLNLIMKFSEVLKEKLDNAPIWYNGPLPTDRAVGLDSIANAIGSSICALTGGDMFLALTDAEHYDKPTPYQSAQAIRTMKVMVSSVEYARDNVSEIVCNHKMGRARQKRNWKQQAECSLYPNMSMKAFHDVNLLENSKPCSLCGAHCPLLVFDKGKCNE